MPSTKEDTEQKRQLLEFVREVIARDNKLRQQYQIGEKFRFVRDRLNALEEQLEKHVQTNEMDQTKNKGELAADETIVYIYLYNVHGLVVTTWRNMLTQKLFYEYSVNRPVYADKSFVEELIRSKSNKHHHGYIAVAIKKHHILNQATEKKDVIGNTVIKVKEGAFVFDRLICFTHNSIDYVLDEDGNLIIKED